MKILIFNWRDIKNPQSGGAEILTHEMAKRWVKWGHKVVQFSSSFAGGKKEEIVDRVKILRYGSANIRTLHISVYLAALWWYLRQGRGEFEIVVDEIHGLPFFTPWYVREKKVALICEVANELWDATFNFPYNKIGHFIEKNYFRFYRHVPFLTISSSTKIDLMKYGVKEENITVFPMGVTLPSKFKIYTKEKSDTLIFVGRLTKAKGIEEAIEAVSVLKRKIPQIKLWVVGQGEGQYFEELKKKITDLKLKKNVIFFGFVSEERKFELLSRAHLLLVPSLKEGWGLTLPEAARVGTPSVTYNSSGLRDILKENNFGIMTRFNRPEELAREVTRLFEEKDLYHRLVKRGISKTKNSTWDEAAKICLKMFQKG